MNTMEDKIMRYDIRTEKPTIYRDGTEANFIYDLFDIVELDNGRVGIVTGFHPQIDNGYFLEVYRVYGDKIDLGLADWYYTVDCNINKNASIIQKLDQNTARTLFLEKLIEALEEEQEMIRKSWNNNFYEIFKADNEKDIAFIKSHM